eukprot:541099_1
MADTFSKQFKLKKLLSTVSDDILNSKSEQILNLFSDDIKPILHAFTYCPFLLHDTKFCALIEMLQPEKQTQQTEQTLDIVQTLDTKIDINCLCDDLLLFVAQFLPFQSLIKLELTSLRFMYIARSKNAIQSIDDNILWYLYHNLFTHSPFTDWKWSMIIDRFKNIKTFQFLDANNIYNISSYSNVFTNFSEKFIRLTGFSSSSKLKQLIVSDRLNLQQCMSPNVILNNLQSIIIQNDYGEPGTITENNMNFILSKAPNIKTVECDELYPSNLNYLSNIKNIRVTTLMSENILVQMPHIESLTCYEEFSFGEEDNDDFETFYERYFSVNTNQKRSLHQFNFLNCEDSNSLFVALCIIQQNSTTLRTLHVNIALFQQSDEYSLFKKREVMLEKVTELSVKLDKLRNNVIGSFHFNTNNHINIQFPNLKKLCLYMNDIPTKRYAPVHQFELNELHNTFIKNSGVKLECLELYGPSVNILEQMFDETFSKIICEHQNEYKEKQLNIKIVVDCNHCNKLLKSEAIKRYITIVKDINQINSCCRIQIVIDFGTERVATQIKNQKQHLYEDLDLTDREWYAHKYVAWIY